VKIIAVGIEYLALVELDIVQVIKSEQIDWVPAPDLPQVYQQWHLRQVLLQSHPLGHPHWTLVIPLRVRCTVRTLVDGNVSQVDADQPYTEQLLVIKNEQIDWEVAHMHLQLSLPHL
jgi:hypothetical protein